jgi:hypothetical protein
MKKILCIVFLLCVSFVGHSQYKAWAVGAKLGDPSGLTVRRYLKNDKNAIEFNVGVYGAIWGLRSPYREGNFDGAGVSFNALYLWHRELGSNLLEAYYGFGLQMTSRNYVVNRVQMSSSGMGGLGQAGLEYSIPNSPLSVFGELGVYLEMIPASRYIHPQGGIGARVNF